MLIRSLRKTTQQYREQLFSVHGNTIEMLDEYAGGGTPILHRYNCCGKEALAKPTSLLTGRGCRECSNKRNGINQRISHAEFLSLIDPSVVCVTQYVSRNRNITIQCVGCGCEVTKTADDVISGRIRCSKCGICKRAKSRTWSLQRIRDQLSSVNPDVEVIERIPESGYLVVGCKICDHVWEVSKSNLVTNRSGCPVCSLKLKDYMLGSKAVKVRGYEDYALDYLVNVKSVSPERIVTDLERALMPVIPYQLYGITKRHYPDIFLPDKLILVEVKSLYSLGLYKTQNPLYRGKHLFYMARAKAKAAIKQGYDYRMLVFDKHGYNLPIPQKWYLMSYRDAMSIF